MMLRIGVSFLLLLSILFMPLWLSAILALGAIIYFNFFWEAIIAFLISDSLFGVRVARLSYAVFITFALAAFVLIVSEILKKKLKFYS